MVLDLASNPRSRLSVVLFFIIVLNSNVPNFVFGRNDDLLLTSIDLANNERVLFCTVFTPCSAYCAYPHVDTMPHYAIIDTTRLITLRLSYNYWPPSDTL